VLTIKGRRAGERENNMSGVSERIREREREANRREEGGRGGGGVDGYAGMAASRYATSREVM